MVIHRVFSASSFFFFYIYLYKIYLIMHGKEVRKANRSPGCIKRRSRFLLPRVRFRTVNQMRKRKKIFFLSMSLQNQFRFRDPHGSA